MKWNGSVDANCMLPFHLQFCSETLSSLRPSDLNCGWLLCPSLPLRWHDSSLKIKIGYNCLAVLLVHWEFRTHFEVLEAFNICGCLASHIRFIWHFYRTKYKALAMVALCTDHGSRHLILWLASVLMWNSRTRRRQWHCLMWWEMMECLRCTI